MNFDYKGRRGHLGAFTFCAEVRNNIAWKPRNDRMTLL